MGISVICQNFKTLKEMKIKASIAYRWKIFANSLRAHVLKHLFGIENAEKLLVQIQINYFQKNKLGFC